MQKEYKCARCGKIFKRKSNYDTHVFSKRVPCDYTIINTNHGKVVTKNDEKSKSLVLDKTGGLVKSEVITKEKSKFLVDFKKNGKTYTKCLICGIEMLTNCLKKKHLLEICYSDGNRNVQNSDSCQNQTIKTEKNEKNLNSLLSIAQPETHDENDEVIIKEPRKKRSTKKEPTNIIHNHYNTQIINNEIINNFNVVNNNLNIYQNDKLNAFGKENLEMLTQEILNNIIANPNDGIVKLIKFIHFNPSLPENRNIMIKNKKEPYIDVFNGDYWEKQEKEAAIHNLISTKKDIMDDHFETLVEKNMVTKIMKNNYSDFSNTLDPYLKDNLDKLLDDKINKKEISEICESLYKNLYAKIILILVNDKEINKVLQRKLNKLPEI